MKNEKEMLKMEELKEIIKSEIIENIEDFEGVYCCDLVYEMYNHDFYVVGIYQAKEFLRVHFDEMLETLEDYKLNFGEDYPEVTNVEKLATLVILNQAEKLVNNLQVIKNNWDNVITEKIIEDIKKELI